MSLDPKDIGKAIRELEKLKTGIRPKLDEICRRLAEDYAMPELASRGYGGSVSVSTVPTERGQRIVAAGENIGFLEYGTGDLAGTGEILGTAPVPVQPGSWSESHANTYAQWKATGAPAKGDGSYRYEQAPKSGMFWAMEAMRNNVEKVAKEVFRE